MGDRRSPSPSGHITLDIRVILAHIFGPICGDDHPYITQSDFLSEQWKILPGGLPQGRKTGSLRSLLRS
jgi:hypothetical protein